MNLNFLVCVSQLKKKKSKPAKGEHRKEGNGMRKNYNNITNKLDDTIIMLDGIADTNMLKESDFFKLRASRIMLAEIMDNIQWNYTANPNSLHNIKDIEIIR